MENVVGAAFDILSFTAIVVLVVLGLGVIASMMGIFNFAHGEFVLLGAYIVFAFHANGLPEWLGMIAAPFAVGAVGLVLERLVIRRFYAAPIVAMLGTYALGLAIRETVRWAIGGRYYAVPEPISGFFTLFGVHFATWRAITILVTFAVMTGSYLLLTRTGFGLRVRAALENPALARAAGISTSLIYAATFSFGAALAGLAGAMIVPAFSMSADLGIRFLIEGFLAVMLGGIGTFQGPVVGGAIIGLMSSGFPWIVSPIFAEVLVFVIAIVAVKLRPSGLLGGRTA
jgi:branched-chain amino acid transport system permease protein